MAQRGSQSVNPGNPNALPSGGRGGDRDLNDIRQRQLQQGTPQSPANPVAVGGSSVSTPRSTPASPMHMSPTYMSTTVSPQGSPPYVPSPVHAASPAPQQISGQYNQQFHGSSQPVPNTSYWPPGQSTPSASYNPSSQHPPGTPGIPTPTGQYASNFSTPPISPQQVSL